jgi:two-component system response regulator
MTIDDRRLTFLLVEDDPGDVLIIEEALKALPVPRQAHVVCDGREAWDFLRRIPPYADAPRPDVILLDLNMPRMDGRELLTLIKADDELSKIPTVVFTTSSAPEDVERSYQHHANAYVTKPADLDLLNTAIRGIDEFFTRIALLPRP